MEKQTLNQLELALTQVGTDLASRVEELAEKSTAGLLTEAERIEYARIVRLNDLLSTVRLQVEDVWSRSAAS